MTLLHRKYSKLTMEYRKLLPILLCLALRITCVHLAPVSETDPMNDIDSSGDSADPGPTVPLGDNDKLNIEDEYQLVKDVNTPPLVYKTMTPGRTTGSTTLPPIPPTTTFPTIPPHTTRRKADVLLLDTTLKALVEMPGEKPSTTSKPLPPGVEFTTAPVSEVKLEMTTRTTTPSSTTEVDNRPILQAVQDGDTKTTLSTPTTTPIPTTTILPTTVTTPTTPSTTTPTTPTTTKTDSPLIIEVESDNVALQPTTTSTTTQPSTTTLPTTTTPTTPTPTTPSPTPKQTTTKEVIIHFVPTDSELITSSPTPTTTSTTVKSTTIPSSKPPPSTTVTTKSTTDKDDSAAVIPGKSDVGDTNKLDRNDTVKSPDSSKTGFKSEATYPNEGVYKPEVQSNMETASPSPESPEVVEDGKVNATLIGESKEGGLSYGARVGIAMGCIVGFWIIVGPLVCLICKMRDKKRDKQEQEAKDAREKANNHLVGEMVKSELQKTPNGEKKKLYNGDKMDDGEIEPITIGHAESIPYMDADAHSRDTAL